MTLIPTNNDDLWELRREVLGYFESNSGTDLGDLNFAVSRFQEAAEITPMNFTGLVFEEYTPDPTVEVLTDFRTWGYMFFGVHAEAFQHDPHITALESELYKRISEPFPEAPCMRRVEIEGWTKVFFPWPGLDGLDKEELVRRIDSFVFCLGTAYLEPTPRIWPTLASNPGLRYVMRSALGLEADN